MKGLLIAVEPEESVVVAQWSLRDFKTDAEVAVLKEQLERKIGSEFVIIDTRARPEWERHVAGTSQVP